MELSEIVDAFVAKLNLSGMEKDADGIYSIDVDGMTISFSEVVESRSVAIYGEVGEMPVEGRDKFCEVVMKANFMGQGTGGATLSLDESGEVLYMHRVLPLVALDGDSFFTVVESFINMLETWRNLSADYRPSDEVETVGSVRDSVEEWLRA